MPLRVQILEAGAKVTAGDRNRSYGEPSINLGLAGQIKYLCRQYQQRDMAPGELEALDLVITKVSRCFTGGAPGRDTYVDGATYFAIAGECAELDTRRLGPLGFRLTVPPSDNSERSEGR